MSKHLWTALLLAAAPAWADGQGYTFFAPATSNALHIGGGGEGLVYKGLGAGGEIGWMFPSRSFLCGVGLASANASYHWNARSHWKVSPFVTGGYAVAFRGGAVNLVNAGGGFHYWLRERTGLRVEYRAYSDARARHYLHEVRIGLALR